MPHAISISQGRPRCRFYAGNIELACRRGRYLNGQVQHIAFPDGRLVAEYNTSGTSVTGYRTEYFRTDHLGNTRLTFSDFNQDGVISWQLPNSGPSVQESEITSENHYYPFGLGQKGPWYASVAPENKYRYNGKEWNDDWGLNMYDYGARGYMPDLGRWGQADPLAERYYAWSGYNYVMGNPVRLIDPDGRSAYGDIYNLNGKHIGNDGKVDNQVYVKRTTDDTQLTREEALAETSLTNACDRMACGGNPSETTNLTTWTGVTHEQFQQFAANVYNEAPHETSDERDKVASAIVNRKETSSQGGSWQATLDKIMFNRDSHDKKMSPERANPNDDAKVAGTSILMTSVATENYQEFYNASPTQRNNSPRMKDAVRATIGGLTGTDKVNGANSWRGLGQGLGNRFFKEKK